MQGHFLFVVMRSLRCMWSVDYIGQLVIKSDLDISNLGLGDTTNYHKWNFLIGNYNRFINK